MDTRTTIFLFLAIFYSVLFGMLALVPIDVGTESLVDNEYLMPDSFLISECTVTIIDIQSTYYTCGDYEFNSMLITSTNETHITVEDVDQIGFFGWILSRSQWGNNVLEVFGNINTRVTGLHPVFQFMLWTPLSIMLIWLIVQLIVWITPFIGGGS